MAEKKKAKFIEPPNVLKQKVGDGGMDQLRLQRAEDYIDDNPADFRNIAFTLMEQLEKLIKAGKSGKISGRKGVDMLTHPIMELKATGGMFRYMLVSEIADIVLNFLENIDELNEDVFEIIDAHQNTLNIIINNKLQGTGGVEGRALAQELYGACRRYYTKYKVKPRG